MTYQKYESIDFREVISIFWHHKYLIILATIASLSIGIWYLHTAERIYKVALLVTPPEGQQLNKNSSIAAIANLTGGSLFGATNSSTFDLYLAGLTSIETANKLATDEMLMRKLFPSEWSENDKEWRKPVSVRDTFIENIKRMLGVTIIPWSPPNGARLQEYLEKKISFEQDNKNPLVAITIRHNNPALAKEILEKTHHTVDKIIREMTLDRANKKAAYLTEKLTKVTVTEHKQALVQELAKQEKILMATNSGLPYAAIPFGNPNASIRPVSPIGRFVLAASLVIGLLASMIIALLLNGLRHQSIEPRSIDNDAAD